MEAEFRALENRTIRELADLKSNSLRLKLGKTEIDATGDECDLEPVHPELLRENLNDEHAVASRTPSEGQDWFETGGFIVCA